MYEYRNVNTGVTILVKHQIRSAAWELIPAAAAEKKPEPEKAAEPKAPAKKATTKKTASKTTKTAQK